MSQSHSVRDSSTPDSPYVDSHAKHSHSHHYKAGNKRKANRVQRACLNCRKRKQGCEEERPCRRCVEKGIECVEVEAKRKRGRAKFSSTNKERSKENAGTDDLPDYEDDSAEDSYESEDEELSSDEDQSTIISPRGGSSNANSSSDNVVQTFTFKLNGSNTGSNSNLHHTNSQSASHSHKKSNANSSVPLSNSSSAVPIFKERNVEDTEERDRGKETKRERVSYHSSDYLDISSAGDIDELSDPSSEGAQLEIYDVMDDSYTVSNNGLNLSLLLPLIGNLSNVSEDLSSAMLMDDEYNYRIECEENSVLNGFDSSFGSIGGQPSKVPAGSPNKTNNTFSKIWSNDFSFYTNSSQSRILNVEEGDSRAQIYLKECWEEFQQKFKGKSLDSELQQVNDRWKDILKCLRSLDWQKAQTLMEEMNRLPFERFGEHIQPSVVCWSAGGRIHYANDSFCNLVGFTPEELKVDDMNSQNQMNSFNLAFGNFGLHHDKIRVHSIFHPEEMMKITKRQLDAVQHPEKSSFQLNTRLVSKQKMEIPISCSILNLRDTSGLPLVTIAVFV